MRTYSEIFQIAVTHQVNPLELPLVTATDSVFEYLGSFPAP